MADVPRQSLPAPPVARSKALLAILLAVGLVLVIAGAAYRWFWLSRPIGSGPAGPKVASQPFAHAWTTRRVMLVGMGDSVTAGFGASRGHSYFELLVTNPPDEYPDMNGICLSAVLPHFSATNISVSGSISHELAETQLRQLPRSTSDAIGWVVITTGGNDLIHNYGKTPPREQAMYGASWDQAKPWIEHFAARLEAIIVGLAERFPGGCEIFLANIYDPSDDAGDLRSAGLPDWPDGLRILAAYNEVIRNSGLTHTNVHVINFHDAFLGHGLHCAQFWSKHYDSQDPHYWYYANLEDPNDRGYDAIRRLFLIEMAKVAARLTKSAP